MTTIETIITILYLVLGIVFFCTSLFLLPSVFRMLKEDRIERQRKRDAKEIEKRNHLLNSISREYFNNEITYDEMIKKLKKNNFKIDKKGLTDSTL